MRRDIIAAMNQPHGHPNGLHTKASRAVGEPRLEGENPRSRMGRAAARDDHAQSEGMAVRASHAAVSRCGAGPREIPDEVLEATRADLSLLRQTWDRMYPENPIVSKTPKKPKAKRKHKWYK